MGRIFVVWALFLIARIYAQTAVLEAVSVPPNSQDAWCYVVWHATPSVSVPPYPFPLNQGVGYLVNPTPEISYPSFVLHDHVYAAPYVPDPARARVSFRFNVPVAVGAIIIEQHTNGIAQLEGFAGNAPNPTASVGSFYGTYGNIQGSQVFPEFMIDTFLVPNPTPGTHFDIVIRRTSLHDGWATYRMIPLDTSGAVIGTATFGLEGCAQGTLGAGSGAAQSPLSVNGQTGGASHLVSIPVNAPLTIAMAQPSTNALPSNFVIIGLTTAPDPSDALILPSGVGTLCMQNPYTAGAFPGLFVLTNSFGPDPLALVPSTPAPWTLTVAGLPYAFQFAIQGVIEETPGVVRVTNGVLVNIQ